MDERHAHEDARCFPKATQFTCQVWKVQKESALRPRWRRRFRKLGVELKLVSRAVATLLTVANPYRTLTTSPVHGQLASSRNDMPGRSLGRNIIGKNASGEEKVA